MGHSSVPDAAGCIQDHWHSLPRLNQFRASLGPRHCCANGWIDVTSLPEERRAIVRIRAVWKSLAGDDIPRRSQIDPKAFGPDWAHCLFIELESGTAQARFSFPGSSLPNHAFPSFDETCISQRLAETLLRLAAKHIPRVLQTRGPLGSGGTTSHGGQDILYRMVLLPLSEDGERIDTLLAAMTYRNVAEAKELSASDSAWSTRIRSGS
jgi:hypothetical protein